MKTTEISAQAIAAVPVQFAFHYKVMPVSIKNGILTLAASCPMDLSVHDGLQLIWSGKVNMVTASEDDIIHAIRKYYGLGAETIDAMMGSYKTTGQEGLATPDIAELNSEASIAKFLNQVFCEAYQKRATDIHIEPFESELKIRFRIDGTLVDMDMPKNIWHFRDAVTSRIKIMSHLNIAQRRLPQDGRFKIRVGGVDVDARVSCLPTPNGESVVIRLLSSEKLYGTEELGLSTKDSALFNGLIRRPHGMIFVTGPTGSGKTTTLYCCLSRVLDGEKKVITIEDPIEYLIKGVVQLQVNSRIGFTFASGLRSMLRHDPDIMMVGEVRDLETARIAVQAALTGHLVFSTLHTNDAAGGITRLLDMGVEPYLISSSVEAFIAQRLVRRICPDCKKEITVSAQTLREMGFPAEDDAVVYEGEGCPSCGLTGYRGREAIFEFLVMDEEIRGLIAGKSAASVIQQAAFRAGMTSLLQDGWRKIRQGITTLSEVVRVTKNDGAESVERKI